MNNYTWITPLLSTLLGGGVMSLVQFLITRHDEKKRTRIDPERFDKLVRLQRASTEDRLVYLGESYLEKGRITLREWTIYDEMFKHYKDLGGNHYAEEIHKEIERLKSRTTK